MRIGHATRAPFEPGSVFKNMTLHAMADGARLGPMSVILLGSGISRLYGRVSRLCERAIQEAKRAFGRLAAADQLVCRVR